LQGERPRHVLLAELRDRIGSVLLATQSFGGRRRPGEALSLVVIDRIPFAVPDDPLTAARIDRIREQGGDPFNAFQLPRAALALKQGFGRLIAPRRHRYRRDPRRQARAAAVWRHLAGQPAARLARAPESIEDVAAFWARRRPDLVEPVARA